MSGLYNYGILLTGSSVMDVTLGEGNIYATICFAEILASHSSGLAVSSTSCVTLFTMQHEISHVKRARLL